MLLTLLALSSTTGVAHAQDSTGSSDAPLAIPVGGSTGAPQTPIATTTASAPPAPKSAADLKGAMDFRSGHLEIRTITSWHGGGSWVIHQGYGWGRPGPGPHMGVGFSTVVGAPMVPDHGWSVFQGANRLSVPEYLDVVKDPRATDLRRRIQNNHNAGVALTTVGVVGLATVVTSFVAASADPDPRYYNRPDPTWQNVGLAGSIGAVFGFGGASLAHGTARRLETDYGELGWEPTRTQVDQYNDKLRTDLGLSPDQAWSIIDENGGSTRPR